MKLMTKELEKEFAKYPLYSQDSKGENAHVVVKYFNPCGIGTWLITEGSKNENGEWILFGYCMLQDTDWGYVSLKELEEIKLPFGLTIEQELYTSYDTVKEYLEAERR